MSGRGARPPTLSRRLLEWSSRRLGTPELADDAAELFADEGSQHGARAARRWYRRQMRAALGIAIGAVLSGLVLARFDDLDASLLHTPNWPFTLGTIALFVMGIGLLACARPTLRLVRIRPADELKG